MNTDTLSTLNIIIERADEYDSMLGLVTRESVDTFIRKHSLTKIERNKLVFQIIRKLYTRISALIYQHEETLMGQDPKLKQKITYARNQRRLEAQYLLEKIEQPASN